MKKTNLFLIAFLLLCTVSLPLAALDHANFQGNCASGIPTVCNFDAGRTPAGQNPTNCTYGISSYSWDFDTSTGVDDLNYTTNATPTYTYTGQFCGFIYLSLFCNGGSNAGESHCMCNYVGIGGCIIPGAGWMP